MSEIEVTILQPREQRRHSSGTCSPAADYRQRAADQNRIRLGLLARWDQDYGSSLPADVLPAKLLAKLTTAVVPTKQSTNQFADTYCQAVAEWEPKLSAARDRRTLALT